MLVFSVVLVLLKEQRALVAEVASVSAFCTAASTQHSHWYMGRPICK